MHLSTLLIADHAESVNGKLYVSGGCWNVLFASQFPTVHPHLTVAAALHVNWEATNQRHRLELELHDGDGHPLLPEPVQGTFEAGRAAGMRPGDETIMVVAFNFNGLAIESEGAYAFVLSVDGTEMGRFGFRAVHAPATAVTGSGAP
jgi:hypothetical protein